MTTHEHTTPEGDEFQLRLIQALDSDPMFGPTRYTISAEEGGAGFEIEVDVAPIFYHLLPPESRMALAESAFDAACAALDTGLRERAEVAIVSSGAVMLHARKIAELL